MIGDYNKTCSDSSIDNFIGLSLNRLIILFHNTLIFFFSSLINIML
jgi:hypothetical protein